MRLKTCPNCGAVWDLDPYVIVVPKEVNPRMPKKPTVKTAKPIAKPAKKKSAPRKGY